jgi:uncharacterized protein
MKKQVITIGLTLFLLITSIVPVYAEITTSVPEETELRLIDEADLLDDSEESELLETLNTVSEKQECDVIVVTVSSLNGQTATRYANNYYDEHEYGYGDNKDGILLLVAINDRQWAISTYGYGLTAFTDDGQEYISDKFSSYLTDGEYYKAFDKYASLCDDFLTEAKNGEPYDGSHMPKEKMSIIWLFGSILVGVILGFATTSYKASELKSVEMQSEARAYVKNQEITKKKDIFLYRRVNRVKKPKESKSKGGSSSTGGGHGGSSGSF